MLPKKSRLPLSRLFLLMRRAKIDNVKVRSASTPYFLLKFGESGVGHNRFKILIRATVDKRAARRNFWRRRIAEAVKLWPNKNQDFLLIADPKIKKIDPAKLSEELGTLFSRAMRV